MNKYNPPKSVLHPYGMKMYAELIGNYKNTGIKSPVVNKIVTELERGMSLKECIDKLSEYFMVFRNHFNYIPVMIAQQNAETISLEAFKANKIRPTLAGIADSKNVGKDCSLMLGITNPFAFEVPEYMKYNIRRLKGYARFLEVVLNRDGESNGVLALYFDGATNYFAPLPRADCLSELDKVYQLVQNNSMT